MKFSKQDDARAELCAIRSTLRNVIVGSFVRDAVEDELEQPHSVDIPDSGIWYRMHSYEDFTTQFMDLSNVVVYLL